MQRVHSCSVFIGSAGSPLPPTGSVVTLRLLSYRGFFCGSSAGLPGGVAAGVLASGLPGGVVAGAATVPLFAVVLAPLWALEGALWGAGLS